MKLKLPLAALALASLLVGFKAAPGVHPSLNRWVEVQSSHFTLLTDGGEKTGRELAVRFEQLRSVFTQLFPAHPLKQPVPLEIIAFQNSQEVSRYSRLYQGKPVRTTGFYLGATDTDYIVLDLEDPNRWETAFHEYAHLLLAGNAPDIPAWFNEGFAELYSTIQIEGNHATLGKPPAQMLEILRREPWLPVSSLFSVDHDSPTYNEDSDPRSSFYAESWLAVHYLWDHNQMEQAQRYLQLIRRQMRVNEAVQQAFAMDAGQLDAALQKYSRVQIELLTLPLFPEPQKNTAPAAQSLSAVDAAVMLAGLHAHEPDYQEQAIQELKAILDEDPDDAAAHRHLGYSYYQRRDFDSALLHLRKAVDKSPDDWRAHFFLADMLSQQYEDKQAPEIEDHARQVVRLQPEFPEGYGLLGFALMVEHRNPEAASAYETALALKPGSEAYALNLAEVYTLLGRLDRAKPLFLYLQNSRNEVIATAARSHLDLMATHKLEEE